MHGPVNNPRWLSTGRLIPLLDGLDELSHVREGAHAIADWLRENVDSSIVISGRVSDADAVGPEFAVATIQPLTEFEVWEYLQEALPQGVDLSEVLALVERDPAVREAVRYPWFAASLASLYDKTDLSRSDLRAFLGVGVTAVRPPSLDTYLERLTPEEQRVLEVMRPEVSYDLSQIGSNALLKPSETRAALTRLVQNGLIWVSSESESNQRFRLALPSPSTPAKPWVG